MSDAAPPVHLYRPDGMTFPERILCRDVSDGLTTHVTEFGPQVTCPKCRAIMRGVDEVNDHKAGRHDDD